MTCAKCGAGLPVGAMFCGECGAAVVAPPLVEPPVPPRPFEPAAGDRAASPGGGSRRVDAAPGRPPETAARAARAPSRWSPRREPRPAASNPVDHRRPEVVSRPIALPPESPPASPPAPRPRRRHRDDDLEATRIVGRRADGERFVLQFSTGENVTVYGSGLIGRNPAAEPGESFDHLVAIRDPGKSVSKTHLEFGQVAGAFWVSDRFSGNGSVLRQPDARPERLQPGKRQLVTRGSRIDIGEQFLVVS
jgi:hypothetical protein